MVGNPEELFSHIAAHIIHVKDQVIGYNTKKVHVGNDQEKAQSEISTPKTEAGKTKKPYRKLSE